jgi:hypothetical protein
MMLVAALAGIAVLTLLFYNHRDEDVIRLIRSALVIVVGTALWFQVAAVIKVQRKKRIKS